MEDKKNEPTVEKAQKPEKKQPAYTSLNRGYAGNNGSGKKGKNVAGSRQHKTQGR